MPQVSSLAGRFPKQPREALSLLFGRPLPEQTHCEQETHGWGPVAAGVIFSLYFSSFSLSMSFDFSSRNLSKLTLNSLKHPQNHAPKIPEQVAE